MHACARARRDAVMHVHTAIPVYIYIYACIRGIN